MEIDEKILNSWIKSLDCYGNRMVSDNETVLIKNRLESLKDVEIVKGNIKTDYPNKILVDITHLTPKDFQPNKKVFISLSHFIRPCPCKCHDWQYECYLNDCTCCTDECT